MKNALLGTLSALILAGGLMACSNEPEEGVLGGSDTPSIDGVWLEVKREDAVDWIYEGEVIEEIRDTAEMDTADVFARTFTVIRDGAIFGAYYEPDFEEGAASDLSRLKSLGGDRWLMGMYDTVTIKRQGKSLIMEWTYTADENGYRGTSRSYMAPYSGSFPPEEWFIDPTLVYEPDGTRATAKSITTDGEPQERYLVEDDFDWFSFEAEKDVTYDIEIDTDGLETELRLYGKNGTTLLDVDESYISWECPASGTYYFRVGNEDFYEGSYEAYVFTSDPNFSLAKAKARKSMRLKPLGPVPMRNYSGSIR